MRIVGSLLFCDYCKRIIGYVNVDGACVLKDVRLLFFVPIDSVASADEQVVLFRILERGPMKRRCVTDDLSDEPPFKKLKFDNTRSVIGLRARIEDDEPLQYECDQSVFFPPLDFVEAIRWCFRVG